MHNHSYENELNYHVNEMSSSYEKMGTKARFEEEAKGNSEMAYYTCHCHCFYTSVHLLCPFLLPRIMNGFGMILTVVQKNAPGMFMSASWLLCVIQIQSVLP